MISGRPSNLILSLFATIFIVGCGGVSRSPITTSASTFTGSRLVGQVKGGQQPIWGATIQLYQVGMAGDGSSATALGSSTMTNPSGGFSITGNYTCPVSNPQVYLLASGGNPGLANGTNNTAISLIAALGSCSSLSPGTFINLNEVTTVAAVAALSPYMIAPTSIGSGTSDAPALAAAFTMASQYASTATGTAPGTSVPAGDAVPSTLMNSLADIVSACVNSIGGSAGDGSNCGALFTDSTPSGGAAPTNVATALLNILANSTNDLTSLFALLPSTPPFEPVLNGAPSSWAISLLSRPAGGALVDFGTSEQTIRGFGASEVNFGVLPSSQITELYGQSSGQIGLTIMRVQIWPATWISSTQTANTSAWTAELTNAKAAQALGATIFATPWSPPASMKTNNSTNEGSLSTSSYADYGHYLAAYATYARSLGVNLYAISMQNEPDANPCVVNGVDEGPNGKDCYASCLWTAAQLGTWVAGYGTLVTQGANPVKLMMPESSYFNQAMSDPTLDDPAAVGTVSIIGGHQYATAPAYYANAVNKGKDVWMTEHYLIPVSDGTVTAMPDAIAMAKEIHNSMTVGDYNAYVWWEGPNTNPNISPQEHLINASAVPTYFGLSIAQFSRFVRPGYFRYNATATPVTGVYLSAYGGNGHQVIVVINSSSSAVTLPVLIANQTVNSMTPYQTTSSSSLSQLGPVTVTNNGFSATLPAQSITTYVQ